MTNERRRRIEGIAFLNAFGLTIPVANWMVGHDLRRRDERLGLAPA